MSNCEHKNTLIPGGQVYTIIAAHHLFVIERMILGKTISGDRLSMIVQQSLYVGTTIEDLVEIYVLFIRSLTEYCAVAFHSSLTVSQATDIERIQKTCLKIILGDNYVSYPAALEMTGLDTLHDRRENFLH